MYVSDIWRNIDSSIRLFADDCITYRKITNINGIEKLQKNLGTLGEWAVEDGMELCPGKCKAIRFTRARVKNPLGFTLFVTKKFRKRAVVNSLESYEAI